MLLPVFPPRAAAFALLAAAIWASSCSPPSRNAEPRLEAPPGEKAGPGEVFDDGKPAPFQEPNGAFGPIERAATPPPPVGSATIVVLADGRVAITDPDRDLLHVVDLERDTGVRVALAPGDQPGRAVIDDAGGLHVVLRGAGLIASFDTVAVGVAPRRRVVCAAPRGIAFEARTG